MIEIGNNPDSLGALILHSTESGQFFGCGRVEFERLVAAAKRGELDEFLRMESRSVVADGDADWTAPDQVTARIWAICERVLTNEDASRQVAVEQIADLVDPT